MGNPYYFFGTDFKSILKNFKTGFQYGGKIDFFNIESTIYLMVDFDSTRIFMAFWFVGIFLISLTI